MQVAVCRLTLHINSSHSLKEKRRVVQSLRQRLSDRFGLAVAEVDNQDTWQLATLGLAVVGGSRAQVQSVMDKALEYVYVIAPEVEVSEADGEVFDY